MAKKSLLTISIFWLKVEVSSECHKISQNLLSNVKTGLLRMYELSTFPRVNKYHIGHPPS